MTKTKRQKTYESQDRKENGLETVTKRFTTLLKEAPNKILSIKELFQHLELGDSRRLYDIISVLEGVGQIEKLRNS